VWGIPEAGEAVTVELSDGNTLDIAAESGVARALWESSVGIESIEYDGMSDLQRRRIASYLPAPGINC
jgi:hypothetical protein